MARRTKDFTYISNEEKIGILPCPFCGEFEEEKQNHLVFITTGQGWISIHCDACGCNPDFCLKTKEEAIAKWNSRVGFSPLNEFRSGIEHYKRYLIDCMKNDTYSKPYFLALKPE